LKDDCMVEEFCEVDAS